MIDIKTNFHDGSLSIENTAIPHDDHLFSTTEGLFRFSKTRIKKRTIYSSDIMRNYRKCFVESISIEYNCGKIKKTTINFIEKTKHNLQSAIETKTSRMLGKITKRKLYKKGFSESEFNLSWGKITLIYDIKTSSSAMILYYKIL